MKEIHTKSDLNFTLKVPGSKSVTHRALITACLADGISHLTGMLVCEDTVYTYNGLKDLGFEISRENEQAQIFGRGKTLPSSHERTEIFLGNSGTSLRLLLSTAALCRGEFLFSGTNRMHERPINGLVDALNELGGDAACVSGSDAPPVLIRGHGIKGGRVKIEGKKSSQYVSSILLAAPYAEDDVEIEISDDLVSRPYVDVTLKVMEDFGISVEQKGYKNFRISKNQRYTPKRFEIEGDVSTASYFWAAAAEI
jgi:3-phosphoshikimate 1-carboxyvinyltransferase